MMKRTVGALSPQSRYHSALPRRPPPVRFSVFRLVLLPTSTPCRLVSQVPSGDVVLAYASGRGVGTNKSW